MALFQIQKNNPPNELILCQAFLSDLAHIGRKGATLNLVLGYIEDSFYFHWFESEDKFQPGVNEFFNVFNPYCTETRLEIEQGPLGKLIQSDWLDEAFQEVILKSVKHNLVVHYE